VKDLLAKFNKTFENRYRLAIMAMLMVNDWVDFNVLKELLPDLTDGNLANHIKHLEDNQYIEVRKQFVGRRPQTSYSATIAGRKAFQEHLDTLENFIRNNK
jgi:DNA-binding HxlR family transcriptional regulator